MRIPRYLLCVASALALVSIVQADHHEHPVDISGVWKVDASTDDGSRKLTWTISEEGGKLRGTSLDHEDQTERTFTSVRVTEAKVVLEIGIESGGQKGAIRIEGEAKSPDRLVGKWRLVGDDGTQFADGEFRARREISVAGEWEAIAEMPNGESNESALSLTGSNADLAGKLVGAVGEVELGKVKFDGEVLTMDFEFRANGTPLEVLIEAKPEGRGRLTGEWKAIGDDGSIAAKGKWSAKRKLEFVGKWDVVAPVPNNDDYRGILTLMGKNGKYAGTMQAEDGEVTELSGVKVNGKSVTLMLPIEIQGNSGTIKIQADRQDNGSLQGQWVLLGGDNKTEYARESWKATRR